jgi:outer membrane lipoprotein-sorting protein
MNLENVDTQLSELLEKVRPQLTAALTDRAAAAIRSARPVPIRSRRRLIAMTVGAAVVLFALGFVPIPLGRTKGALDRAMAAFEGSSGVYIRSHSLREGRDKIHDAWYAAGGLSRDEYWENGELTGLGISGADFDVVYDPSQGTAHVDDRPPGSRPEWSILSFGTEYAQSLVRSYLEQSPGTFEEWRERSLWRGEIDVIEATLRFGDHDEETMRIRWETDAATGRLIGHREWVLKQGRWELVTYTEEMAWDVDIPSDTFAFVPPKGTRVTCHHWWKSRFDKTLAAGQTSDWRVTVHALDAKDNGDILLTLSRHPVAQDEEQWIWIGKIPVRIEAVDNLGVAYQDNDGHYVAMPGSWVTTLIRDRSAIRPGRARNLTLAIHLKASDAEPEQILTLAALPLPPLREEEDLFRPEVIQY